MISYRYGGKRGPKFNLRTADEMIAVRTRSHASVLDENNAPLAGKTREALRGFSAGLSLPEFGIQVLRAGVATGARRVRDRARAALKSESDVRFAGRVLSDPVSGQPVLYTENLFVKFHDNLKASKCRSLLKQHKLRIRSEVTYARNAWIVAAPDGCGTDVFNAATALLSEREVELCHPELVRELCSRGAFPQQWHLKKTVINGKQVDAHAGVEAAWSLSEGDDVIIAVIDDGMDLAHEEFAGAGKIVSPRDVTRRTNNPSPGDGDNHGTACAGVACANGRVGASGVAPHAKLMPIRLASGLGAQAEADAFVWAADHGADVISCSWGPYDGVEGNPVVPIPDSTRLAIDHGINRGRNGKGCVIAWAAGNGNESADTDGYASYRKVISVGACSDKSRKSVYSDYGQSVWCTFPSSSGLNSLTSGIWTTDRSGSVGYNYGSTANGDASGNYTNRFGGTSSSCPGVAGVAALILKRNPDLRWDQVKDIIKNSCDRIDPQGGQYNAAGHSDWYGYGRVNARKAVQLALPPQPRRIVTHRSEQDVPIRDNTTSKLAVAVGDTRAIKAVKVHVNIEHSYVGDLQVGIKPPPATGIGEIVLHRAGTGGGNDNLVETYDEVNAPDLAALRNLPPTGNWTLIVRDNARQDEGTLKSVTVQFAL